jgi:glutamate dehydrogenase/leucine dehydrogenase
MTMADVVNEEGGEHERIEIVHDPASGLRAVVAVHSTVLGPALGGLRVRAYPGGLADALRDALALSSAMTAKAAAAGLDLGGGKAVILDDGAMADPRVRAARLRAFARVVEALAGTYITAEDVGTATADMDLLGEHTRHVVGRSVESGGHGDPSPATARTVHGALRAALAQVFGSDDPSGRRVGVIGLGKVGGALAAQLCAEGADVLVCDLDGARAKAFAARHGARVAASVDEVLRAPLDVVAPCATGGMIDAAVAAALDCRVVCGAANNQLSGAGTEDVLHRRGILHVPDELANAGGLILCDAERRGAAPSSVAPRLDAAVARTADVLRAAAASGRSPRAVADGLVAARLATARAAAATVADAA